MRAVLSLLSSTVLALGLVAVIPQPASAMTAAVATSHSALGFAKTRKGDRYQYGGTGPHSFDCSGLVQWAYKKAGRKKIPRTASAQAAWGHRIKRKNAHLGDLVFFHSGGHVYHAALYAGHNRVFHASRPGKPIGFEKIWTSSVYFERAR
jgi:cell wall-associated NlpC family hydrolase